MGVALAQNTLITATTPTRIAIIVLVSFTTLLIIVIGTRLARMITAPILELVSVSKEVAEGNLKVKIDPTTNDEIALLTENFNTMIESVAKFGEIQEKVGRFSGIIWVSNPITENHPHANFTRFSLRNYQRT